MHLGEGTLGLLSLAHLGKNRTEYPLYCEQGLSAWHRPELQEAVTPTPGLSVHTHRALPLRRRPRAPGRPSQVDTPPENIYTMTENICRCFACCKRKPVTKIQMDIEPYFTTVHNLARSVKSSNLVIQIHILIKPSRNAMKCKWNANEMHFK